MTDEEREPRGEKPRPPEAGVISPRPPLESEAAVTSFIRGVLEGAILLVPATLFLLFFAKAFRDHHMDQSPWASYAPSCVLLGMGGFLVGYWFICIVRAYRRGQPFRSVGLVAAIPAFLVFFGMCTMALFG
ncbi:MAG TPA: hypothetical protein PKL54_15860 [Candidatus Hydrogenedentes bacterium]|nr:hypothetical protein [Candidatus Hydrogenedentota bacterium]